MGKKLRTRSITGLLFGVVMISCLAWSSITSAVLFLLIAIGMAYEYGLLATQNRMGLISFGIILAILPGLGNYFGYFEIRPLYIGILISLVYCGFAIFNLYARRDVMQHNKLHLFHCFLYLGIPFYLLVEWLFKSGIYRPSDIISLFALIWICDSAAYIFGSRYGKTPLFKKVSPNKTREGSYSAGLATLLTGIAIFYINQSYSLSIWLLIAAAVWIFGTYGDLVESSIKRFFGVKDSGNFLPGHGGFLDRFDSFIFVIPFVSLILFLFDN